MVSKPMTTAERVCMPWRTEERVQTRAPGGSREAESRGFLYLLEKKEKHHRTAFGPPCVSGTPRCGSHSARGAPAFRAQPLASTIWL